MKYLFMIFMRFGNANNVDRGADLFGIDNSLSFRGKQKSEINLAGWLCPRGHSHPLTNAGKGPMISPIMRRMRFFTILALALFPCALFAQDLPTLQARVTTPVLQELMGGCSLKCAFPWEVTAVPAPAAAIKTPQPVYSTNDDDAVTAWIDQNASSIGTKLVFGFPKKLPKVLEDTPFYGFDLANGDIKTEAAWKATARVKRARLYYNNKPLYYVEFADTRRWQTISFDDILARHGDTMTLEILEVYPGTKSQSAAITELVLQGAH
jgi:hypothetical protein